MAFKFRRRRKAKLETILKPVVLDNDEGLTGFVRGFNATDIEERFARALIELEIGFWFQYKVETEHTLPDQQKRVDFIVFYLPGHVVPVEIYGDRWHTTASDRARDRVREMEINEYGKKYDWDKLKVVWGHELQDQNAAYQVARRLFI
jgi:hypothetical protein